MSCVPYTSDDRSIVSQCLGLLKSAQVSSSVRLEPAYMRVPSSHLPQAMLFLSSRMAQIQGGGSRATSTSSTRRKSDCVSTAPSGATRAPGIRCASSSTASLCADSTRLWTQSSTLNVYSGGALILIPLIAIVIATVVGLLSHCVLRSFSNSPITVFADNSSFFLNSQNIAPKFKPRRFISIYRHVDGQPTTQLGVLDPASLDPPLIQPFGSYSPSTAHPLPPRAFVFPKEKLLPAP